ncbi:hypothetical protein ACOCJ7_06260 [Knoellia sp. CPCC 206453]|uniref:hypothetical protein n=1 Tax=Knoellia pratensis TaxID=3404796 RepID=UPI003623846B
MTQFDAHGPRDAVVDFVGDLTRWIAAPDLAELSRESSVLKAEAAMRGSSDVRQAMLNRYGARGPGLAGYAEPGLARVSEEDVRLLASEWFTSGNAALLLDGPPPAGLALNLPEGPLRSIPAADPCEAQADLPKMYVTRQGITTSGVVARSTAATFLGPALHKLMHDEFRGRDGAAYAPWSVYEAVDADTAVVFAGSDVSAPLLSNVVDKTLEIMSRVATSDALSAVVPDLVAQARQANDDPYNALMVAYRAASDHLRGREPQSAEAVREELLVVDADAVRRVAQEMHNTLLLGVDGEAAWADQMPRQLMPTRAVAFAGSSYRSRNFPAIRDRLVIGDSGIALGRRAEWAGIARNDVEAVMAYPDGAREIVSTDGWSVRIEPTLWRRGGVAAREADALVDEERRLVAPPRTAEWVPQPMTPINNFRSWVGQLRWRYELGIALIVLSMALLFCAVWWWTGDFPVVGGLIFIGTASGAAISLRRQQPDANSPG